MGFLVGLHPFFRQNLTGKLKGLSLCLYPFNQKNSSMLCIGVNKIKIHFDTPCAFYHPGHHTKGYRAAVLGSSNFEKIRYIFRRFEHSRRRQSSKFEPYLYSE